MTRRMRQIVAGLALGMSGICALSAHAASLSELGRLKGQSRDELIGIGIVVGLNGTGDSSKASKVAARPYAQMLANLGNGIDDLEEIDRADGFAVVMVTMTIPATSVHEGDEFDLQVSKLYNASSLAGGRLVSSLLRLPVPGADAIPYAIGSGRLTVTEDDPSSGIVVGGGRMITDVTRYVVDQSGRCTFILDTPYATLPIANVIAAAINDPLDQRMSWTRRPAGLTDEEWEDEITPVARVRDARTIQIRIPRADRQNPNAFLGSLLSLSIDSSLIRPEARIVIDERTGTIVATDDVEIGPVAITQGGLQLSGLSGLPGISADDVDAERDPDVDAEIRSWAGLDTTPADARGRTRLADLLGALEALKVPVSDRIAILEQMRSAGRLNARIIRK